MNATSYLNPQARVRVRWVSRHCRVDLIRAGLIERLAFPMEARNG